MRHQRERVERYAAGTDQRLLHVGQMEIQEWNCGWLHIVIQAELSNSFSFRLPRVLSRARKGVTIAFEHRDVMASPSQHHRRRECDNTGAQLTRMLV